jgi:hypothetical protein
VFYLGGSAQRLVEPPDRLVERICIIHQIDALGE